MLPRRSGTVGSAHWSVRPDPQWGWQWSAHGAGIQGATYSRARTEDEARFKAEAEARRLDRLAAERVA